MIKTLHSQQRFLNFSSAFVLAVGGAWVSWLTLGSSTSSDSLLPGKSTLLEKELSASTLMPRQKPKLGLPAPSKEAIAKASRVNLHRMNPPQSPPPPTPTTPPPQVAIPVTPPFAGRLLGIIQDHIPDHSFAILQWPDNRIQLVSRGKPITEESNSPVIEIIDSTSITLRSDQGSQVLELSEQP
jgi:hypothetical protein